MYYKNVKMIVKTKNDNLEQYQNIITLIICDFVNQMTFLYELLNMF